jgi:uncharacterized metal-binding protein
MLTPAYRVWREVDPANAVLNTGLLVGAHLLSGMMFSPDLDLDSAIDDRWGAFHWIWWPYTWLIPHRHFWSHGLIVAPLLRLVYFYGVLNLLIFAVAWVLGQAGIIVANYHERLADAILLLVQQYPNQVLIFLLGFITGSAAHTAADWLVTGGKRYLTRLGYRPRREYLYHDWRLHTRQPARRGRPAARGW